MLELGTDRNNSGLWHEISKQIPWSTFDLTERMAIADPENIILHGGMINSIECRGLSVSELLTHCQTVNHPQMYKKAKSYIVWGDFTIERRLSIATEFDDFHVTISMLDSIDWGHTSFEEVILLAASELDWHIQDHISKYVDLEQFTMRELNQIGVLGGNPELWEAIHQSQRWLNATTEEMLSL